MLKTITKHFINGPLNNERAGNLEFKVSKIRGVEYLYFRIGATVAKRAGLQEKDKVLIGWDDETGYGVIKPSGKGWALQSGNLKVDDPPLVVRVTRKPKDNPPYLEELGVCQGVKVMPGGKGLEFYFPSGTIFGNAKFGNAKPDNLFEIHREIVEKDRPTRKDEVPQKRIGNGTPRTRNGKPYGRRATDE